MGLFFERFTGKSFNEAEVDGKDLSQGEQSPDYGEQDQQPASDTNADNNEQPAEDNSQEQPQDDNQQNQDGGDDQQSPDYGAEDDFNYDDSGDDQSDDGGNDQGGQPAPDASAEEPVDDIKKQEEDIYASLSAEQLDIKHEELKNQFLNMFDNVNTLIEKVGNIVITEENAGAIEYVSTTLTDLHDMVTDYLYSVYKTKSYTENSINYNRFLAVLHGINKILEEVAKKEDK